MTKKDETLDDFLETLTPEEIKIMEAIRHQNLSIEEMRALAKGLKYPNRSQVKKYDHNRGTYNFKFALIGDTHFGNKSTNKEALHDFYKLAKKKGVREFYHAGDLVDGLHVHRGQEYELYALGMEQQARDIVNDYPHIKGARTYYILGNHDLWYKQNAGGDISKIIDCERDDMECLGESEADVKLTRSGTTLRLMHPGGGSTYALSYRAQKIIEAMSGGNKPNILGIGHYHKSMQMFYRNIATFLVGCFEEQTPFMRSKNLAAHVGGWIIEGKAGKGGGLKEITATFVPYMKG